MAEPAVGSTLGGYRIEALIARGGMGVVYRATQLALDRPVALKVIARDLADKEGFRERFLRESRLAARLEHPSVVPVYDSSEADGELFVAMRLVGGGDLKRLIAREGPLEPAYAIDLLAQIGDALDAAHGAGIVHRDVKPHNILVEPPARAYLTDFGLAKAFEDSGAGSGASVVGTVEYMAPEQWRGEASGPAADIYSLGCVLYEALTGVVPYARREASEPPRLPRGLDRVIERAVDRDPRRRFSSAGELIESAREHEDATPAPTLVLSDSSVQQTPRRPPGGRLRRLRDEVAGRPGALLAAASAAVLAIVLIAIFARSGGDPAVSDPIPVGKTPLRLAAGEGGVWVTSGLDGTLARIDPETMEVDGDPLRLGRGISAVAVGAGSVWVSLPPDRRHPGRVLRVDPVINRVTERIEVGGRPGPIVVAFGRVWVADGGRRGITVIDPSSERPIERDIEAGRPPLRLAAGASAIWVTSAPTAVVRALDPETTRAAAPIRVGRGPAGVTTGGGDVWVANSRSGTVSRIDAETGEVVGEPIEVGEAPGGIDAGSERVWVANAADGTVQAIDIDDGRLLGEALEVGRAPGAVVVGEGYVWVANNGDNTVSRIEP